LKNEDKKKKEQRTREQSLSALFLPAYGRNQIEVEKEVAFIH
jgi:hypothetical protein